MKTRSLALIAGVLSVIAIPTIARADWTPKFEPPTNSSSHLKIDLPDDLDILILTSLGVEIDGIDVTSLLSLDGTDFIYTPVEPFSGGEHVVRLIQLGSDGSHDEKGQWSFSIGDGIGGNPSDAQIAAAEKALRSAYLRADTLTELSQRVVDRNTGGEPDRTIVSGAGDVNAGAETEKWSVTGRTNYLLQSDQSLSQTGNVADIGEYDITVDYNGETMKGGMNVGHHDIGLNSLVMSNYYRRGASLRVGTQDDRAFAQGFSFGTESLSGVSNFTGLTSSNERITGVTASVKPFSRDLDALKITGVYYSGKGANDGTGISDINPAATGSGWGIILEKGFDNHRTLLQGQYANATYDADGDGGSASENNSSAISASLERHLFEQRPVLLDSEMDVVVGFGYDRIDTYFASLSNPGLAADRNAFSGNSTLNWGAFSSNLHLVHETNNVDDLPGLPTDRLRQADLNMAYSFDQQTGDRAWLGTPYVNLSGFVAALDRQETPSGYVGPDTDNISSSLTLGGGASYGDWYWGASQTHSQFDDYTNEAIDTVSNLTGVNGGWTLSDRLNLFGGVQFGVYKDKDTDQNGYMTNLNLGTSANLIPEVLDWKMDYNLNLMDGTGDSPDSHLLNTEMEWTFLKPQPNNIGLALAFRGSMESINGNADSSQNGTEYQAFLVLRVKAPVLFRN
ncbi:MAG: hypothetical protein WD185_10175 [Sneathiella sp.]